MPLLTQNHLTKRPTTTQIEVWVPFGVIDFLLTLVLLLWSWWTTLKDVEAEVLSREEQAILLRIHVNHGHLPLDAFLRMLKDGGVRPGIRRWVKNNFICADCESRSGGCHSCH